jgi:hypothetical protein
MLKSMYFKAHPRRSTELKSDYKKFAGYLVEYTLQNL